MTIEVGELEPGAPEVPASADMDGSIHSRGRFKVTQAIVVLQYGKTCTRRKRKWFWWEKFRMSVTRNSGEVT